jgi:hypothetical protein
MFFLAGLGDHGSTGNALGETLHARLGRLVEKGILVVLLPSRKLRAFQLILETPLRRVMSKSMSFRSINHLAKLQAFPPIAR